MDLHDLKVKFYNAYLTQILEESKEEYSLFEDIVRQFKTTPKGILLTSFIENDLFIRKYMKQLHKYDLETKIDNQSLQNIVDKDEEWQELLRKKLQTDDIYDSSRQLKPEVIDYLRKKFSEREVTIGLSAHILKRMDALKLGDKLLQQGNNLFAKLLYYVHDDEESEIMYYKILARIIIKKHLSSLPQN